MNLATSFSDWRSFNKSIYEDMLANGVWEELLLRCKKYLHADSPFKAHKLVVQPEELPLTYKANAHLACLIDGIYALLKRIGESYNSGSNVRNVLVFSDEVAAGRCTYNACTLRHWAFDFVKNAGIFSRVSYKRRNPFSIVNDEVERINMKNWMKQAVRAHPPATAKDFMNFIKSTLQL